MDFRFLQSSPAQISHLFLGTCRINKVKVLIHREIPVSHEYILILNAVQSGHIRRIHNLAQPHDFGRPAQAHIRAYLAGKGSLMLVHSVLHQAVRPGHVVSIRPQRSHPCPYMDTLQHI